MEPMSAESTPPLGSAESELERERRLGSRGDDLEREVPVISLARLDSDPEAVIDQLWTAATEVGFFGVRDHGIPAQQVDEAFGWAERFFALPAEVKERRALVPGTNSGWEHKSQVRPSTGTRDQKESYQVTRTRMDELDLWPSEDELAGFRAAMEAFEAANRDLALRILSAFAVRMGFDADFFTTVHDPASPEYQSTLRLLHYLPLDEVDRDGGDHWRAGAHTDFDCLTLLHQRPGQSGLQLCPGAEGDDPRWTDVAPTEGVITCNIGDMLMRWSDDQLRSTLHRVRMPRPGEHDGPRYSIAFFAQADRDAVIEGPLGRYAPITAHDYLQQRIAANFAA